MTVNYKDWHEMLPFALLAYRTSICSSTGATLYSLVYGMEVVLPIEVEIPSMRVLAEFKLKEAEWAKHCYEQLNLIDERRLTALCHGVRPDFKFPCTMQPAGQHVSHLANPPGKTPCSPQVHWLRGPSPSDTSDYFSTQGSVPFGYVLTTFLLRGNPLRGQAVSTPFWLTFPNNDISNGPSHNLSRILYGPECGLSSGPASRAFAQVVAWVIANIIVWNGEPKWGADKYKKTT
ncbi:hypothetical protein CRG98_013770 [Punica granatum]|uniref:Uncharacterized protein n=1 Tax=Punica granatum TaxID=22663 RepID=A0A2I0KCD3_PUNGR|nr:hypothetical protein CRG98_013770 [Punica granatum]